MSPRSLVLALLLAATPAVSADKPKLKAVVHPVADLVIPIQPQGSKGPVETTEKKLIRLVESTVAPKTWGAAGGAGTVEYFPMTMSLVVNQTPDVQEQVQDLLAGLRRCLDAEVAVEVRIVSVPADELENLGLTGEDTGYATLDDTQVRELLTKAQGCTRVNVTQAPKVTMFNGQRSTVDLTDHIELVGIDFGAAGGGEARNTVTKRVKTGIEINMLPTLDEGRKNVTLQLAINSGWLEPQGPGCCSSQDRFRTAKVEKTLKLGDGKTALLWGWTAQRTTRSEYGPPLLSKVPYVNRVFKNVGYGREVEVTFLLVTPRVVKHQEQDLRRAAFVAKEETPAEDKPKAGEAIFVNQKSFSLAYELAGVGPSKVKNVEVWVTEDDGQTWSCHGKAEPLGEVLVTVPSEGRYGYRLVPRSGAGLAVPQPKSGDKPEAVVVVDVTKPEVVLYAPEPEDEGHIRLKWKASDVQLADKPVSVYYAEKADGPWKPIFEGITSASGVVETKDKPVRCYFRVTATDAAGNVAVATTPEPVVIDTKVPKVRKISVKVKADAGK